jgi:acetyltransferase-like isoleucine patch superfamily enzyme
MFNNLFLLARDFLKYIVRFVEQLISRLFYIERNGTNAVSLSARLDIGPSLLKGKISPNRLIMDDKSSIEDRSIVNSWIGEVRIGKNSTIGIGCVIIGPVSIGRNTSVSQGVFIAGENRIHKGGELGLQKTGVDIKKVTIGDGVWIGAHSIILPGVTIGNGVTVAAGSVVTKSITENCLVAGVPAKIVKGGHAF